MALIRGYRRYISPGLPASCRFTPTCSQYALEVLETHGFFKGSLLSIWRVLRCNPFGKAGYDPPPEKGRWKNPEKHTYRE